MQVIKRNGMLVDFDKDKIFAAICKADDAVKNADKITTTDIYNMTKEAVNKICESTYVYPHVEGIQDIVEKILMSHECFATAKAYILYRASRTMVRDSDPLMKLFGDLTFKDSKEVDAKRENANIDANTAMGTMLKYGSTAANYYVDNYILPKHIAKAHIDGDIHM